MTTMKAIVFKEPKVVQLEDRPVPQIKESGDVICKVLDTALCGRFVCFFLALFEKAMGLLTTASELHVFRGHQPSPTGFIMGHEFTGVITEVGIGIKHFKRGDKVISPFTLSWCVLPFSIMHAC